MKSHLLQQDNFHSSLKTLRARKTGKATPRSRKLIESANVLINVFSHCYNINKSQLLIGKYSRSGVMYLVAPRILDIINKVNLGNLINIVPELEWLICSVERTREFKFIPHPIEYTFPSLDDEVVVNEQIIELIGELLVITMRYERGECDE
jgi:hypothetical protein